MLPRPTPSTIWPTNLVNCELFYTLHAQQYAGIGKRGDISREQFFVYCFLGSFTWYFPGYVFTALIFFMGLLDQTRQRPSQPDVWLLARYGNVTHRV